MQIYTPEDLASIEKMKKTNDSLEDFFEKQREKWNNVLDPLFESVNIQVNSSTVPVITKNQADILSYRQALNEEVTKYLNRYSKAEIKVKKLRQDKFIFFATGFGMKTNMGEKNILIDACIAENTRNLELIQNYIEFLRNTNKNLESAQYTIKNIIELFNYLGK